MKKVYRAKIREHWNLAKLKDDLAALEYRSGVSLALDNREECDNINGRRLQFKDSVVNSATQILGRDNNKKPRKPWVTAEMLEKMEERRKWKSVNTEEGREKYRSLNNQLRHATDRAREQWWTEQCDELEQVGRSGRMDLLYRKASELTKTKRKSQNTQIRNKDGTLLTKAIQVQDRWKEYIEDLYDKDNKPRKDDVLLDEVEESAQGPPIMMEEFEWALSELKSGKAEGVDEIPAELLKALVTKGKRELYAICNQIYIQGEWPQDFLEAIIIPLEKKNGAQECVDFRTISLIPHASKVVLKILTRRLESKAELFLGRDQYGFRRGFGTRDAIAAMRVLYERSLEHNKKVYVCFVDYEKAFDRVDWTKLMEILCNIGIDLRDRKLIWNLYKGQSAYVRVADGYSAACEIGRGVRQGCSLSPLLFIIYDEAMMKEATENTKDGISVGGHTVSTLRFADDKAVVASSQKELQNLMDNVNNVTKKYGMKINVKKTKVMCISRTGSHKLKIIIEGQRVEQVTQFKYLGSIVSSDGYCEKDIRSRIAMGKQAFTNKRRLLTSTLNLDLKKRIIKCMVWSVALYGAETWTMTQADRERLEAFEMWIWRRMLKISWVDKVSNVEVLQRVGENRSILDTVQHRKLRWVGHILRHESLLRDIIEGRMKGKATRGRKRLQMLSDVINKSYVDLNREVEDRSWWQKRVS